MRVGPLGSVKSARYDNTATNVVDVSLFQDRLHVRLSLEQRRANLAKPKFACQWPKQNTKQLLNQSTEE